MGPDGVPVAGAIVRIGATDWRGGPCSELADGTTGMRPFPLDARTDADGGFRRDCVAPGEHPVVVRARELAPWTGTCRTVSGADTPLLVQLQSGALCTGTVRDSEGQLLAGVEVHTGRRGTLLHVNTRTADDGSYRLPGLPTGSIQLVAEHEGSLQTTQKEVASEQTLRWDVQFTRRSELRGRVLTERGDPVRGKRVDILVNPGAGGGTFQRHRVQTDASGRFALPDCPDGVRVLFVRGQGYSAARQDDVKPADGELVLRVQKLELNVTIRGSLVDENGRKIEDAQVWCTSRSSRTVSSGGTSATVGDFVLGPLPPGTYRVKVRKPGYAFLSTDERRLAANATWDLGTLRLTRGGRAKVTLDHHLIGKPVRTSLMVFRRDDLRSLEGRLAHGEVGYTVRVPPGQYLLVVTGKEIATRTVAFDVSEGRDSDVHVVLAPGQSCELRLLTKAPRVRVTIRGPRGLSTDRWVRRGKLDHAEMKLRLEPGRHTVTAHTESGETGSAEFTVSSGKTTRIDVRLR